MVSIVHKRNETIRKKKKKYERKRCVDVNSKKKYLEIESHWLTNISTSTENIISMFLLILSLHFSTTIKN